MGLEVLIKVLSTIKYSTGQAETINRSYGGKLYIKEDDFYLRYKEESELGDVSTTIKWPAHNPINVTIIRQGNTRSNQIFAEGHSHKSLYQNNLLGFLIITKTNKLEINQTADGGNIYVDYEITSDEQLLGQYNITIKYDIQ